MKWFGSVNNRIEENHIYGKELYVGMGATQYYWSDRHPWEVIKVINGQRGQEEVIVRELEWKVVKGSCQDGSAEFEYYSKENNPTRHLRNKKGKWYEVDFISLEGLKGQDEWRKQCVLANLTETRRKKVLAGGEVRVERKCSEGWSFGHAEYYYDPSF